MTTVASTDQNAILVQLCIKILKEISPNGMTTKELAAALDKEVDHPGFNGISSSILSSKLNGVFRRCHNDSPNPSQSQLEELPLTRSQSVDIPRRLVYRYTPPAKFAGSVTPKRRLSEASYESSMTESSASEGDSQNEPMTPKDESTSWTSSKRRKSNTGTPTPLNFSTQSSDTTNKHPALPDHRPQTPPSTVTKKHVHDDVPRVNLYYDTVGYDAMTAVFANTAMKQKPSIEKKENDVWIEDVSSPENLQLNELDKMVC